MRIKADTFYQVVYNGGSRNGQPRPIFVENIDGDILDCFDIDKSQPRRYIRSKISEARIIDGVCIAKNTLTGLSLDLKIPLEYLQKSLFNCPKITHFAEDDYNFYYLVKESREDYGKMTAKIDGLEKELRRLKRQLIGKSQQKR